MEAINQGIMDTAIGIVQMLATYGHQVSVDGDAYLVNETSNTINGKTTKSVSLYCGNHRCTPSDAMNVVLRWHNAIINM